MEGLKPGRIVYFVFDDQSAEEVMRRRTTGQSIADRLAETPPTWPTGAQAHIGNEVKAGDVYPAMVLRVWGSSGCSNLRVLLDGTDDFWATSVNFDAGADPEETANVGPDEKIYQPRTWHWMFDAQATRYKPAEVDIDARIAETLARLGLVKTPAPTPEPLPTPIPRCDCAEGKRPHVHTAAGALRELTADELTTWREQAAAASRPETV